jgi:hypothetical protein
MKNRSFCNLPVRRQLSKLGKFALLIVSVGSIWVTAPLAYAGEAPQWMHALVNTPLPAHDEKTNAILLYSEENVNRVGNWGLAAPRCGRCVFSSLWRL